MVTTVQYDLDRFLLYILKLFKESMVDRATMRAEGQGLGLERPDDVDADDDEYDAYRKRMMLAYRFRPNPMVSM